MLDNNMDTVEWLGKEDIRSQTYEALSAISPQLAHMYADLFVQLNIYRRYWEAAHDEHGNALPQTQFYRDQFFNTADLIEELVKLTHKVE